MFVRQPPPMPMPMRRLSMRLRYPNHIFLPSAPHFTSLSLAPVASFNDRILIPHRYCCLPPPLYHIFSPCFYGDPSPFPHRPRQRPPPLQHTISTIIIFFEIGIASPIRFPCPHRLRRLPPLLACIVIVTPFFSRSRSLFRIAAGPQHYMLTAARINFIKCNS
jgi:hypothetical protein